MDTQLTPARRLLQIATAILLVVAALVTCGFFLYKMRIWEAWPQLFDKHIGAVPQVAPTPAPDLQYQADSLLARQLLADGRPEAGKLPIVQPKVTVHPLDAGALAGSPSIGQYRCMLPVGGTLTELAPDHHGRILVRVDSSSLLPVVRPLDSSCYGGEILLKSEAELDQISGR